MTRRSGASPTLWTTVATSFIVAGAGLRVAGLLSQGQFYVDDGRLALNIASRSLGGLTQPLDYGQVAPIPFLWLEKLMTWIGGINEHALRVAPLVAAIAVLLLLWNVGRRALGDEPAVLATCLGALSAFLISFASAVKQYSSDALVTLLLVWLVLDVLRAEADGAAWWRLMVGGVVALWLSQPAVFVLAGAALALPASTTAGAAPGWRRHYALTLTAWVSMFAVIYFVVYQAGERNTFLKGFWEWTFLSPGEPDFAGRVWRAARAILVPPIWRGGTLLGTAAFLGGLTSVAFAAGLVAIVRTQGASLALLCAGPYLAVLGAAMLRQYPPADRFLLFAAPLLLFIYASALWWAATALPPRARVPAVGAALALLTLWTYPAALEEALHPQRRRETKTPLGAIAARAPDAPAYLFTPRWWCDGSAWAFFTTDWNAPDTSRLRRFAHAWAGSDTSATTQAGGDAMSFTSGHRQELIGAGARTIYLRGGLTRSPEPDPKWVASESDRIRRAANPIVWLWATEIYPENAIADLLHGIRLRGGRLIFASRALGAAAWEIEFPR